MNGHVLILGGARSGKTTFAERLAVRYGHAPLYLATAVALDDEMRDRVQSHRSQRHAKFSTLEEPVNLPGALRSAAGRHDVILVDCLTLWMTNLLGLGEDVSAAIGELGKALTEIESAQIILVSNEVGLGIVPDNALARTFRDLAGAAHQRMADICPNVYFVAAGLPLVLKGVRPDDGVIPGLRGED